METEENGLMSDPSCGLGRLVASRVIPVTLPRSGHVVEVPVADVTFEAWTGDAIADTYGGKPVLAVNGRPLFAELAILRELEATGWRGVWVDSYRNRVLTDWPPIRGELDRAAARVFDRIAQQRRGRSWDVLAWCDGRVLFVESKRRGKDKIRESQVAWLAAGLDNGLSIDQFLVVEWILSGGRG